MEFLQLNQRQCNQSQYKQIDLKHRSPRRAQMEIINPFKALCDLFKHEDPIQKSKNRVARLQNEIRGEQAKQLYLSGQNDPKIREYIHQRYQIYLKMECAPAIPIICPHCISNINLSQTCSQCGWALHVYFRDINSNAHLLATPTIKAPIRDGESLIYDCLTLYNISRFARLYRKKQKHNHKLDCKKASPREEGRLVRFYPKISPKKDRPTNRKQIDTSGFMSPRKIHSPAGGVVHHNRRHSSAPAKIIDPDRVVKMQDSSDKSIIVV